MADLQITQLQELSSAQLQAADPIAVADVSATETKKITAKNDVNPEIKVRIVPVREFINNGFILIFFLLILYNMQFSIYYKYFDPLILVLILFLIKFKDGYEIKLEKIYKKYAVFYVIFLSLNLTKAYINY